MTPDSLQAWLDFKFDEHANIIGSASAWLLPSSYSISVVLPCKLPENKKALTFSGQGSHLRISKCH